MLTDGGFYFCVCFGEIYPHPLWDGVIRFLPYSFYPVISLLENREKLCFSSVAVLTHSFCYCCRIVSWVERGN